MGRPLQALLAINVFEDHPRIRVPGMTRSSLGTMTRPGAKRSLSEFHESESKIGFTMRVSRFPDAVEAKGGRGTPVA